MREILLATAIDIVAVYYLSRWMAQKIIQEFLRKEQRRVGPRRVLLIVQDSEDPPEAMINAIEGSGWHDFVMAIDSREPDLRPAPLGCDAEITVIRG